MTEIIAKAQFVDPVELVGLRMLIAIAHHSYHLWKASRYIDSREVMEVGPC